MRPPLDRSLRLPLFVLAPLAAGALLAAAPQACGDSFGSGGNTFTIDFADIGSPGNGNDPGPQFGGVLYAYRIGVTEVPQSAIDTAVALGLAHVAAGAWPGANQPAGNLSWYEAAAFVNWLNTSTGHQAAYQLNATATALTLWDPGVAWDNDPGTGTELNRYRHQDAFYFLPSDDEWHKAAFHKNDGVTNNYWDYATGSDTAPTAVSGGTAPGTAVYDGVGTAPAEVHDSGGLSPWGTRGQDGNAWEWQETASDGGNDSAGEPRKLRGGSWSNSATVLTANYYFANDPSASGGYGLRVASVAAVPEPGAALLLALSAITMLSRRATFRGHTRGDR